MTTQIDETTTTGTLYFIFKSNHGDEIELPVLWTNWNDYEIGTQVTMTDGYITTGKDEIDLPRSEEHTSELLSRI